MAPWSPRSLSCCLRAQGQCRSRVWRWLVRQRVLRPHRPWARLAQPAWSRSQPRSHADTLHTAAPALPGCFPASAEHSRARKRPTMGKPPAWPGLPCLPRRSRAGRAEQQPWAGRPRALWARQQRSRSGWRSGCGGAGGGSAGLFPGKGSACAARRVCPGGAGCRPRSAGVEGGSRETRGLNQRLPAHRALLSVSVTLGPQRRSSGPPNPCPASEALHVAPRGWFCVS